MMWTTYLIDGHVKDLYFRTNASSWFGILNAAKGAALRAEGGCEDIRILLVNGFAAN
jgi:hypothetical protein